MFNVSPFLSHFRKCLIRTKFGDLKRQTNLKKVDQWLQDKSYLADSIPTLLDVSAFKMIETEPVDFIDLSRWWRNIKSYQDDFAFLPSAEF